VRLPGQAVEKTKSEPDALVNPLTVSRSGLLTCDVGGKKKPRWVVLGAGNVAIYGDKKDFSDAKPPKATLAMASQVSRVVCNSMSTFAIVLSAEIVSPGPKGKPGKPIAKAGESINFTMDDSKELTGWVTDLTAVVRAYQQQ